MVHDITERKRSEQRIKDSLQEKEVLLKEVHHRVKNNLQVISSLVSLQSDALVDPAVRVLFADVRDRVRSMALVHEKLYQSESFFKVPFADYARGLLEYLWRAHGAAAAGRTFELDVQPVTLPVDRAVPCGLILNELASNALKHAFAGRASGKVAVVLRADECGQVHLTVSDDGVGLPEGMDWREPRSLGLRLVQMLTGQLKGAVQARTAVGGGVEFEITFAR
jgi:two-component sensor histidine kinase